MDKWRWLACPHCGTRLERKNPRYLLSAISFFLVAVAVGPLLGHRYIVLAYVLLSATVGVVLVLLFRIDLQVRKPPPPPEIRLNIQR
jgi:hypothetical protein